MSVDVQLLVKLFGDIPQDSSVGGALKIFVGQLMADARNGGAVGSLFKVVVEAGRKPDDSIYRQLSPQNAAAVQAILNALKGAIDG